jgi:acyl-CoA thioesterase-2
MVDAWNGRSVPELLALEQLDLNLFRNRLNQRNANDALFGGQVLAQALTAANMTVEDRLVHSLHGYFLRAGKANSPVIYQVDRSRDGGRFSTRRVVALQRGEPIFHMELGFHAEEPGYAHQRPRPLDVPLPEALDDLPTLVERMGDALPAFVRERWARRDRPISVKPVDPVQFLEGAGKEPRRRFWLKLEGGAEAVDEAARRALLTYLSDYWLAGTAALPHTVPMPSPGLFIASLDHAMWFHRPARVDDWLYIETESPSAQGARGLALGYVHDRDGALVATMMQEALMRPRRQEG